jgi:hypothetical protein
MMHAQLLLSNMMNNVSKRLALSSSSSNHMNQNLTILYYDGTMSSISNAAIETDVSIETLSSSGDDDDDNFIENLCSEHTNVSDEKVGNQNDQTIIQE